MRARQLDFVALQQSFCFVHEQTVPVNYSNRGLVARHRAPCQWRAASALEAASSKASRGGPGRERIAFSTISVDNSVHILYIRFLSNAARRLFFAMHKFATAFLPYRSIACDTTSQCDSTPFQRSTTPHFEPGLAVSPTFVSWTKRLLRLQCRTWDRATS